MTREQPSILLDTNIWVDCFLGWRSNSKASSELIDLASRTNIKLLYAIHTLKDIFYIINMEIKRVAQEKTGTVSESDALAAKAASWACIENICDCATAIGADSADAWLARKYRKLNDDFEDNLILAAAQRANANFIVTSDKELLQKATVPAHTPQDAIAVLELMSNI